jgi:uncharacterized protein (TIGR00288 family)
MTMPFTRAPHRGDPVGSTAPNAALLIDFDNVTMGMRSDLSRDLKKLLQSDVIRGKVTVQRAYADWRRYPQYIVPLSENSIDLIFAPAYGSSKKNATDIRMAIDAMELVFVRPEIGTFILLTGDSDFSSAVLKLKEYGKYVIGVGIQESSSDILVQNCDEYYSYTSLTGLQKTTGGDQKSVDPWVLVEKAVRQMAERDDVMRSDRLKQVMIEIDPTFDEGGYGFSKFSRFITEAASKNLIQLRKMENGQYEVAPYTGGGRRSEERGREGERGRGRERGARAERGGDRGRGRREERGERVDRGRAEREDVAAPAPGRVDEPAPPAPSAEEPAGEAPVRDGDEALPLQTAYRLLTGALEALKADGRHPTRDSDVKRRMLEIDASFDEAELGFGKFSRFLRQAHDHEVVDLHKQESGNYEVALPGEGGPPDRSREAEVNAGVPATREVEAPPIETATRADATPPIETATRQDEARSGPVIRELRPEDVVAADTPGRRLGPRGGTTRRRGGEEAPSLFEGQAGDQLGKVASPRQDGGQGPASAGEAGVDPSALGLPTDPEAQIRYLTNSYKGVGKKTAEALVEQFGENLFTVLEQDPARVQAVVPQARAERVLEAWEEDLRRRREQAGQGGPPRRSSPAAEGADDDAEDGGNGRGRRGGRRGRRSRGGPR